MTSKSGVTFKEDPAAAKNQKVFHNTGKFESWEVGSRYQLSELLGKGSYGQVAKAIDRCEGKSVAIKQMKRIFDEPIDAKRAYREMHILRHLRHPSVVSLFDVISSTIDSSYEQFCSPNGLSKGESFSIPKSLGNLYLIFEFVDTDLGKIIKSNQYLSGEHIQYIIYQILDGLRYIHATNVIHRDLKPANILVSCSDCTVKIADFGLSRVVGSDAIKSKIAGSVDANDPYFRAVVPAGDGADVEGDAVVLYNEEDAASALPPAINSATNLIAIADPQSFMTKTMAPPPLALKRGLTKHVITRWYRAPEVILSQNYSAAVDMWSIGCIFAELLSLMKENCVNYRTRRALFPGESCGELSAEDISPRSKQQAALNLPDEEDMELDDTYGNRSQLSVIFDVMGTPAESELSFLDERTKSLIRHFRNKPPKHFKSMYPGADDKALELLRAMLQFNPNNRSTSEQCLNHPYFKTMKRHSYLDNYQQQQLQSQNEGSGTDGSSNGYLAAPMNPETEKMCESDDNLKYNIISEILSYRRRDQLMQTGGGSGENRQMNNARGE